MKFNSKEEPEFEGGHADLLDDAVRIEIGAILCTERGPDESDDQSRGLVGVADGDGAGGKRAPPLRDHPPEAPCGAGTEDRRAGAAAAGAHPGRGAGRGPTGPAATAAAAATVAAAPPVRPPPPPFFLQPPPAVPLPAIVPPPLPAPANPTPPERHLGRHLAR